MRCGKRAIDFDRLCHRTRNYNPTSRRCQNLVHLGSPPSLRELEVASGRTVWRGHSCQRPLTLNRNPQKSSRVPEELRKKPKAHARKLKSRSRPTRPGISRPLRNLSLFQIAIIRYLFQEIWLQESNKILHLIEPVSQFVKRNVTTNLRQSRLEKVGRFTSANTFSLRSSGATRNKGILRFGCIATRSAILNKPE
jgi:hypothetical protein